MLYSVSRGIYVEHSDDLRELGVNVLSPGQKSNYLVRCHVGGFGPSLRIIDSFSGFVGDPSFKDVVEAREGGEEGLEIEIRDSLKFIMLKYGRLPWGEIGDVHTYDYIRKLCVCQAKFQPPGCQKKVWKIPSILMKSTSYKEVAVMGEKARFLSCLWLRSRHALSRRVGS